jgi:Zn-dependent M28 family amino/carboxypeptidase
VLAAGAGAVAWMVVMPGRSHSGPLRPLSPQETLLREKLKAHVAVLARNERNTDLETAARYIEKQFGAFTVQEFPSQGRTVRNIQSGTGPIVVGAHYDSVPGSPGADDNASAVAVLIELQKMLAPERLPIAFVAFVNEELPYSFTLECGAFQWARRAREGGESVRAMFSLEMLGYYSDDRGSQRYPWPLSLIYPDRANFIAFVGDLGARALVRKSIGFFRKNSDFPSEGVAAPAALPGIRASDHWSFRLHGFPAIMVTDTAYNRNPHYHRASDTPDKLDYDRMTRVAFGLAAMLRNLSHENQNR